MERGIECQIAHGGQLKYLSFDSHHPVHVKQGVVKSLFDRARRIISQESDLRKEEDHLNEVLRNNGYPKRFIYENSKIKKAKPRDEEMEAPLVQMKYYEIMVTPRDLSMRTQKLKRQNHVTRRWRHLWL